MQLQYLDNLLCRLEAIQNAAAHLVTGTQRQEHVMPVLRQLIGFQYDIAFYSSWQFWFTKLWMACLYTLIRAWYSLICIIVTACLSAAHSLHSAVFSMCRTPLLDFSVLLVPERMHHPSRCSSTGCHCRAEFSSNCLCTLMFDICHGTVPQYLSELVWRSDSSDPQILCFILCIVFYGCGLSAT